MSQKFKKCKEDFICLNCGKEVKGNGYTNHCPHCLYSLHVDVHPGDRLAKCNGLMEPIRIESERKDFIITSKCKKCGYEKRNKAAKDDNLDAALEKKNLNFNIMEYYQKIKELTKKEFIPASVSNPR